MHYDLLAKIKNAERAKKESFQTPFSKFDLAVAKILVEAGYLREAEKKAVGKKNYLEVKLKYNNSKPALSDFRIMSKPGRRLYVGHRELRPVKQGYGLAVISTPAGAMSGREAKKRKVGGEYLFEVW